MSPRWDELWPAPEPPDDFALRVLVTSIESRPRPRRWRQLVLAAIIPCLCLAAAATLTFYQHQQESARKATVLEAQRRDTEDRLRRLQSEFEVANRREQELQASLSNAKDEVTRAKLQSELESARQKSAASARRPSGASGWAPAMKSEGASKKRACAPGDALCDF